MAVSRRTSPWRRTSRVAESIARLFTSIRSAFGAIVVDGGSRQATRAGVPVTLTAREFDLLWFLASHPRRVFSRDQLMERVWGYTAARDTGTVTVHIRRLREKLEADPARPQHLQTVWGVGYRLYP